MHTVVKIKHSEYERYGIKWYYSIIKIVTAAALLLANGVHLSDGLVGCNLRYSRWASGLWENGSLVPGNLMWIKPESDESQLCHPGISIRIFHSVCSSHFLFMTQFPNAAVNFDLTIWSNPRNCSTSSDDDLAENCCSLQPDPHQITRTRTKWLSEDPSSDMFKKLEAAYCSQDETAWNQLKHSHDWDHGPQKILTCMLKFTGREAFNLISICVRVCVCFLHLSSLIAVFVLFVVSHIFILMSRSLHLKAHKTHETACWKKGFLIMTPFPETS